MSRQNPTPREMYASIFSGDTKRDVYEVAGYPEGEIEFEVFHSMFKRNGFANAIVMKPVQKRFSSFPCIYDFASDGESEPESTGSKFERDVNYLIEKGLFTALRGLAWRQRVGRYGGIVIVSKDETQSSPSEPAKPLGVESIIGFRPVFEGQLLEGDIDMDMATMNFGNPETYNFNPGATNGGKTAAISNAILHRSRVYVFSETADDGTIWGTSSLEPVFNDLLDLQKVCAAGAEGHWKNASQRIHVNINDADAAASLLNDETKLDEFNEKMDSYTAGFDKSMMTAGMTLQTLQTTLADPTHPFTISLQKLVAGCGIPKTVLIGFETGERSSEENASQWDETCNSNRQNIDTPMIKGFLQHLIDFGFISKPDRGICIEWDDLTAQSDVERLENADKMAGVNQKLFAAGLQAAFSSEEVREAAGYKSEPEMDDLDDGGETEGEDDQDAEIKA